MPSGFHHGIKTSKTIRHTLETTATTAVAASDGREVGTSRLVKTLIQAGCIYVSEDFFESNPQLHSSGILKHI